MEEHLCTASFWRLLSNCSDSRKLLILQKIIRHKLGNKPALCGSLVEIINNKSMPLTINKQPEGINELTSRNKHKYPISQLNMNDDTQYTVAKLRVAPVMGTNALFAKYNHCEESTDSKIISNLVNAKFNRKIEVELHSKEDDDGNMNCKKLDLDLLSSLKLNDTSLVLDEKKLLQDALKNENLDYQKLNLNTLNISKLNNASPIFDEKKLGDETDENRDKKKLNLKLPKFDDASLIFDENKFLEDALGDDTDENIDYKQLNLDVLSISKLDDTSPIFDEKKFLTEALGEETNSIGSDMFDCFEYESEDTTQPALSISITSSRVSSLISKATSLCTTLKKRLYPVASTPRTEPKLNISVPTTNSEEAHALLQEATIQHQVIVEACKALNVCLSSKEFLFGPEHIEAERILLLALCKQNIAINEMKYLKYKEKSTISKGSATISDPKFPLSEKTQKEGYMNWFVAIISCEGRAFATKTVVANSNSIVQFEEEFKFVDLQHDFEIDVSIYSLLAKTGNNQNRDSEETASCLQTPEKMLCRRNSLRRSKQFCLERHDPSFKLWGKTTVSISDLERSSPFPLEQVPNDSNLKGFALMNFKTRVEFLENHSGFLTLRTECDNGSAWNHRWCNLIGHTLYYWNYPADLDLVEPIGKINLQQCATSEISMADRNMCARPRTLFLETVESGDQGNLFFRHFLSAESTDRMLFWKDRLNEVLRELKNGT